MAKEAKPEAEADAAEAAPPKKSKKLLIIIAAALTLFLVLAGGATYFLMKGSANPDAEGAEVATEKNKGDKKKSAKSSAPVYVALDAFTVNLVPENDTSQFLQLAMSVEVADILVSDRLKSYTPKLRNNVMMLLSGKKADELLSKDGKEKLANEVRDLINAILEESGQGDTDEEPVKEVLFTSFIIQ